MEKIKLISILSTVLLAGFLGAWLGVFNVSAKEKHWEVTTKLLEFVRERSIKVRADSIQVPDLSNYNMISNGAKNFDSKCSQCHLAPTVKSTELSLGLYPQPPVFYKEKHSDHLPENTFWTIKNGLKLTGMPAWGDFHTDEQIWEMVAFLEKFKGMTAFEYLQLTEGNGQAHKLSPKQVEGDDKTNKSREHRAEKLVKFDKGEFQE